MRNLLRKGKNYKLYQQVKNKYKYLDTRSLEESRVGAESLEKFYLDEFDELREELNTPDRFRFAETKRK